MIPGKNAISALIEEYSLKDVLRRGLVLCLVTVGLGFGMSLGEAVHESLLTVNGLTIIIPWVILVSGSAHFFRSQLARAALSGFCIALAIGPALYGMLIMPEIAQRLGASSHLSFIRPITILFVPVFAIAISSFAWTMSTSISTNEQGGKYV